MTEPIVGTLHVVLSDPELVVVADPEPITGTLHVVLSDPELVDVAYRLGLDVDALLALQDEED